MGAAQNSRIEYLSPAEQVSMGNAWFEIANLEHFWIRRRFEVLQILTPDVPWREMAVAEVGCGDGLLQRQCEDQLGISVDGYDLNEAALRKSICRRSRTICYNVHARLPELREKYDVLFLFDVIEHIEDERAFLDACLFHVRPGGTVIINVPADNALFSAYDTAAGHVRRYLRADLEKVVAACGLTVSAVTYWGRPLRPLLHVRKARLSRMEDHGDILRSGFDPRGGLVNEVLYRLSSLERIPQTASGSSLMLIAKKPLASSAAA